MIKIVLRFISGHGVRTPKQIIRTCVCVCMCVCVSEERKSRNTASPVPLLFTCEHYVAPNLLLCLTKHHAMNT